MPLRRKLRFAMMIPAILLISGGAIGVYSLPHLEQAGGRILANDCQSIQEARRMETVLGSLLAGGVEQAGSIETAVETMKEGAFDCLTKPFSPDQVRHRLRQIERVRSLQNEVGGRKSRVGELPLRSGFMTRSVTMAGPHPSTDRAESLEPRGVDHLRVVDQGPMDRVTRHCNPTAVHGDDCPHPHGDGFDA